jgi:predicted amidohydrolase YtcJ
MTRVWASMATACSLLACSAAQSDQTLLFNGVIHTIDPDAPFAEAVLIANGEIVAVGNNDDLAARADTHAYRVDLEGMAVLPGFQDIHLHALEAGLNDSLCFLPDQTALGELESLIADCALNQAGSDWFFASGVNMTALLEVDPNPVARLDGLFPDRPALILDDIGHGAWANSHALSAVGYDQMGVDPPGGILHRSPTGDLTGVVFENAQQALRNAAFPPTSANLARAYEGLLASLDILAENGVTTISDAGGYWPRGHHQIWQRVAEDGLLSVRAHNALYVYPDRDFDAQIAEISALYANNADNLLRFNQVKLYVDGIVLQGTAALMAPYEVDAHNEVRGTGTGFLYFTPAELTRYAQAFAQSGFLLHFHVTGDRGARLALDAIEASAEPVAGRHRLTHLYLVDPSDQGRFTQLAVAADFQMAPSSLTDEYEAYLAYLLGARVYDRLPARALIDAGALITLSSDWDAESLSPLERIETVVTLPPDRSISVTDAIAMTTLAPAQALGHDDMTGSVTIGKRADLVILDRNPLDVAPDQIGDIAVIATLLDGEPVFDPNGLFE